MSHGEQSDNHVFDSNVGDFEEKASRVNSRDSRENGTESRRRPGCRLRQVAAMVHRHSYGIRALEGQQEPFYA